MTVTMPLHDPMVAARLAASDLAREAVIVTSGNGEIADWNSGAERLYGWSSREAVGQPAPALFGAELDRRAPTESGRDLRRSRDGRVLAIAWQRRPATKILRRSRPAFVARPG